MTTSPENHPHCHDWLEESIKTLSTKLDRVERSIVRLRHARFSGLMAILALGIAIGMGAIIALLGAKYRDGQMAVSRWRRIQNAGIEISIQYESQSTWLTVRGDRPMLEGGKLVRNADHQAVGASFGYNSEQVR